MKAWYLSIVFWTACGNAEAPLRFVHPSGLEPALPCTTLPNFANTGVVADLINVDDTSFAAVYPDERRLTVYNASFRAVRSFEFDPDGPRGVRRPVSAAITDTAVYVADDARSLIRRFDLAGNDRGTVRLPFIPRRVRLSSNQLLVTPLVAGGSPAELVFRIEHNRARPLGAPIARYDDINLNTLANMTSIAAFPDRVVVMHEMVVPFGYVINTAGEPALTRRFTVPVAATERDRLERLPRGAVSEKNVNELVIVAFAAAADPGSGAAYYVTRSGDGQRRPYQKLVIELDSLLEPVRAFSIDAQPHQLAYLAARHSLISVDANSQWSECRLPTVPR